MVVFKRKQIVILTLVLMIVVAGYLQYNYNESSISTAENAAKPGEAVYVDNEDDGNDIEASDSLDTDSEKVVKASKHAEDYFAQAKLERDMVRSRETDSLKSITEDPNAEKESKDKAYKQTMQIISNLDREMKIEALINKLGFDESLVLFGDDESVDVVVKAPSLSSAQTAQIADVVSRQGKVPMSSIHIKNIF